MATPILEEVSDLLDSVSETSFPYYDEMHAAEAAGLQYVTDLMPGISRKRHGDSFEYFSPKGKKITDAATLDRIKKLAIPPAYTNVWICQVPSGHIQATGRDAKNRKQYRYHAEWRATRDESKFHRMAEFAAALPQIRSQVDADLRRPGLPRPKVLATIVRLLETTHIRVGNEEYARANGSYGLTTLSNEHVTVDNSSVHFHFRGKSGKDWTIDVLDKRLAAIVRKSSELPGQHLFEYTDAGGTPRSISSSDVNTYIKEISGSDFTAKDFRTWAGTVLACRALCACEACESATQNKLNVTRAIKEVSNALGNTPAVCRKCYIHPAILQAYLDGTLQSSIKTQTVDGCAELNPEEAMVLAVVGRV